MKNEYIKDVREFPKFLAAHTKWALFPFILNVSTNFINSFMTEVFPPSQKS